VSAAVAAPALPRLGFLGTGWIGRSRLEAIVASGAADIAAIADPDERCRREAARAAPDARLLGSDLDDLLAGGLDGIVIATPSALHAEQAIAALDHGIAVFCQKPLGRSAAETQAVVGAARRAGRLLGVDMSYRHTAAALALRERLDAGAIGPVHAVDLVFHNAYGPDKAWFSDPQLSGGGCVIDLGIHLLDLALWLLGDVEVESVAGRLHGAPLEDHAEAQIVLAGGPVVRLTCSWRLHAGRDCVLEASLYGTQGGVSLRNVGGSFYDFVADRYFGTHTEVLATPPDDWSGRAAVDWARRVAVGERFDPQIEDVVRVHEIVDLLYERRA
jgi:predicted dehydrogenase